MVHIEDRVLRRRLNVTHPAAEAANIYVHIVVWIAFQRAAAARIETYLRHSSAGIDMRRRQPAEAERQWEAVARSPDGDPFALADFHAVQGKLHEAEGELRRLLDSAANSDGPSHLYSRDIRRTASLRAT